MTQHNDRPLWALAVLTFGLIDPILAAQAPRSIDTASASGIEYAFAISPAGALTGLILGHMVAMAVGYAVWRRADTGYRTAVPVAFAMLGMAMIVVRFAAIGGVV